jgi:DNA polymerase-1
MSTAFPAQLFAVHTNSVVPTATAPFAILKTTVQSPRIFLIDTYGFIFRAYHARARTGAPPMRTSTGISTEVVYIFSNMLRKLTRTYEPEYMAAVFESLGKTHRETEYAEYKANRAETPDDLIQQVPYVRRLIDALRIPIIQYAGFEADDVIGTLSRKASAAGCEVVIVSSDKDLMQLVTDRVKFFRRRLPHLRIAPRTTIEDAYSRGLRYLGTPLVISVRWI